MSKHTTFKIGGPADRLYMPQTRQQLKVLVQACGEKNVPYFVLGNGSNLLVSDKGIRGAVLCLSGDFKEVHRLQERGIRAGAAATLACTCAFARDAALGGLEFAWGIPGFVGGAAYMDAGAYGGEMRDVVTKVEHMTSDGCIDFAVGSELAFDYRKSRYTGTKDIILSVEFELTPGVREEISAKMEDLMGRRKEKQPYDMPSAGSIFKRPPGAFAAALIEECGLKGTAVGGAQVSPKHAGFIVNTGGATCAQVLELIEQVQETVLKEKGVALECEVRVTGET